MPHIFRSSQISLYSSFKKSDMDDLPVPDTSASQSDVSGSSDESDSSPESSEDKPDQLVSAEGTWWNFVG